MSEPVSPEDFARTLRQEAQPGWGERLVIDDAQRKAIEQAVGEPIADEILRLRPCGDRIVLRRERPEEQTAGGIYKPSQAIEQKTVGWILSCGPQTAEELGSVIGSDDPRDCLGVKVLVGKFLGGVLKVRDTDEDYRGDYLMVTARDVWALVERGE